MAFLLAQPFEGGGVEVAVKTHDGFAGWGLLVAGAVEVVGCDLFNWRELHAELKAALEQHFVAHGLRVEGVEQAGFFFGDEGFECGQLRGLICVGVGRKVGTRESTFFKREYFETGVYGLRVVAVTLNDSLHAFDGDVADFFVASFVRFFVLVSFFWDLANNKTSLN